jgi:quinol monooxygenase YgiN
VDDQCVFTTFERFADRVAMERHNASPALVRFLQRTKLHLDGDVVIHVGEEIASR